MTASSMPASAPRSGNGDWVRALQRTAAITPASTRTIATVIDEMALRHPDRPALVGETDGLDYAGLGARTKAYARWAHREGLRAGDVVALVMGNAPDQAAIWIGLSRLGIVTALVNTQLVGDGLAHCLGLAAPARIIVDPKRLVAVVAALGADAPPIWIVGGDADGHASLDLSIDDLASGETISAPVSLADPALLIYTSGTTGLPKAARVSHYRIMMWSEWFAGLMDASSEDRLYNCLPMYHSIGGVVAVGAMLVSGGAVIVREGFSARRFWGDVAASRATIFQYIGELCRYLVNAPDDGARLHGLRLCIGNGLRADVWQAFEQRFDIPRIIEFYAATEGSFSLFNLEGRPGSIGRVPRFMAHRSPVAIVRFDVVTEQPVRGSDGHCLRCAPDEPGEAIGLVAARSDGLATRFEGYTSAAESERKILRDVFAPGDTWFRTGDLMRQDAQGFFTFVDRIGDTFRWKGENVSTAEVADVLGTCHGVREATVYGVAMPGADGRAGMAALVVGPEFDLVGLQRHVAARLPKFARPLVLRLCAGLDATGTFKVRKGELMRDGFDPGRIEDALYVIESGRFVPLDRERYALIVRGAIPGG